MATAIEVEHLSKKYRIGHLHRDGYTLIRDVITQPFRNWGRHGIPSAKMGLRRSIEEFWAVKDVSFTIPEGQRIGVIGRNGAGKSTLLKLLSRITEPTRGRISIRGRVASLLEVGTGFHPELSGRENVYLNGSILGMNKAEVERKFDEIVAFSGVEQFLDTPVKRYSSGMYVRLAFAVAAHLDPEILIVDEVLAVGDAQFQKKCLGKMETAGKEGRTVIFVSHNLSAVELLCPRAMLMESGMNSEIGPSKEIIGRYLESVSGLAGKSLRDRNDRTGKGNIRAVDVRLQNTRGGTQYGIGDDVCVELDVENAYDDEVDVRVSLGIYSANDAPLISCDSLLKGKFCTLPASAVSTVRCRIVSPALNLGEYFVSFAVFNQDGEPEDWMSSLCTFSISAGDFEGRLVNNHFPVLARFDWEVSSPSTL